MTSRDEAILIRPATAGDLSAVTEIEGEITGLAKPDYWKDLFERYGRNPRDGHFLVAEHKGQVQGFIIGEVRAWEFGSAPCGWIFAINVRNNLRLAGVGASLFQASCEIFRKSGMNKVRTMLARDANLVMSFFRSQGMMAGPFVELEMDLDG